MSKPNVFISYSHRDVDWKDRMVSHLGVLQAEELLTIWSDTAIGAGEDWLEQIETAMDKATVAILLISAHFLTSQFILRREVSRLLERRHLAGAVIVPVLVRPCAWDAVPWLAQMQLRPRDARALSGGSDYQIDADFTDIAREVLRAYSQSKASPHLPRAASAPIIPATIALTPPQSLRDILKPFTAIKGCFVTPGIPPETLARATDERGCATRRGSHRCHTHTKATIHV